MKAFDVGAFQATDRGQLQRAARELGHGLHTRSPGELARIRRELAEFAAGASTDHARGFLEAIEHVLAGASAEARHRRHLAEDVTTARLRKNAVKAILALDAGCELPSEIAARTGLKLPAVSAELAELEREGLVEKLAPAAGEDQRTSPRILTGRGARIARELVRSEVSPTAEAARELAPVFISFFDRLADEGCVARERLTELAAAQLGPVNGAFVCDEFLRHAEERRTLSSVSSAFALTTAQYVRRWHDCLEEALQARAPRPSILQPIWELASAVEVCLRATSSMRDLWCVALRKHEMRNVHAWCFDDARAAQLPAPRGRYAVVWENPEVLTHDLGAERLRTLVTGAERLCCYAASGVQLPANIERLEFDARHVGG